MLQAVDLTIRLNPADDVVIARVEIPAGTALLKENNVRLARTVPAGHKVAVRDVKKGQPVRRYNQIIGFAMRDIAAGEHVHVHNVTMGDFERDYAYGADAKPVDFAHPAATFQGIVRADGRVATRNYIGILTSVNCSATVARMIARHFENRLDAYPNVDGVVALTHKSGCGMDSEGEGVEILRRTLAGYAHHPNFFAVQLVGLGCEANQIDRIPTVREMKRADRISTYTIQEKGGTGKAVREGIARVEAVLAEANKAKRETVPASHLTLGLQCGGSDGYSGISANPALGAVAKGGTTNLVDVYEYAEHVTAKGFVYMDTPGFDPVSATGQVAGGANMICFTTGRGSAYGCKPAPSLKLATNSALFEHQEEDMDINCGTIIDGKESVAEVGHRFFELVLETASGKKTKSELFGYGDDEFAPWIVGATM